MIEQQIEDNMPLVYTIVNLFKPNSAIERDDFVQAGRIGLWKALKKFDPTKGKLSTVAWNHIKWEILKEIKIFQQNHSSMSSYNNDPSYVMKEQLWEVEPATLLEEEKLVLQLRSMGYRFKEIKDILGHNSSYTNKLFISATNKIKEANEEKKSFGSKRG